MTANFLNTSHQKLSWFSDLNAVGRLDLRPSFQRRPVWSDADKAFLVDTILRGYPVPEIYIYTYPGTDGSDVYAVVDGQQRLRACLEFMETDKLSLTFDLNRLQPLYTLADTPWFGKTWSGLTPAERARFRAYKLITRELEDVGEEEIRHMFGRLNQGNYVLNNQELRYSMYQGGLLGVVEGLVERPEWDHFRLFTALQRRRMLDSEYISELVIGYLHWPQNKKDDLDHYFRQYAAGFPFAQEVQNTFAKVLVELVELFPEPHFGKSRWYRKSDFYTLFLAMARGRINLSQWDKSKLRSRLIDFSAVVTAGGPVAEGSAVAIYRLAVERAASDRTRRVRREDALISYLHGTEVPQSLEVEDAESEDSGATDEETAMEYADREI